MATNQQNKEDSVTPVDVLAPLKQITPLSKYLAMALFVILPFLGGWVGYTYAPERVVEVEKVIAVQIQKEDSQYGEGDIIQSHDPTIEEHGSIGGLYFQGITDGLIYYSQTGSDDVSDHVLLEQADPRTFKVYKENTSYARDKNYVYFLSDEEYGIPANPTHDVKIITGADPETFQVNIVKDFPVNQGNLFQSWLSKDKNNVYYRDEVFEYADPKTFVITNYISINYDKDHVFFWRKIIPNADPDTYEVVFDTSTAGRGFVFGRDDQLCFKGYKTFNCKMMPSTWHEAYLLAGY